MAAHEKILLDRKTGKDTAVGGAQRNARTEGGDGVPNPESDSVKLHTAAMRQQAGKALYERGFATSVRPNYRNARTSVHSEIDIVEQRDPAPIGAEPAEDETVTSCS
jgi:hypothetical protein